MLSQDWTFVLHLDIPSWDRVEEKTVRIGFFILSLGIASWIRVEDRLVRVSERTDMDQQVVTVDQFTAAMASI